MNPDPLFLPPDAVAPAELRRALVIKLRNLGDVLLAAPVVSALKAQVPQVEVDAMVYADTADMLRGHPDLAQLHEVDRNWKRLSPPARLARELRLLGNLRRRGYDLVINLTDHGRGAWVSRLLRPRYAVAPDVRKGRFYRSSYTHLYPVVGGNRRHTVEINLDALRRIGLHPAPEQRRVVLAPGEAARASVERLLADSGLKPKSFVLIHPGSRWFFKCWPPDRIAALCTRLAERGLTVALVSGPDPLELRLLESVRSQTTADTAAFPGNLSLKELAALIGEARLMVGMDSAPMHMAAAMGTPVVAFFGPSGEVEWGPWQVPHRILASAHACRPCGRDGCGGGKRSECLESIRLDDALDAVLLLLEQTG
ncbi:MAG TPA: putative lipopolysaccharide heptosyltransferase III [Burkholderiales bacterium]|nr:putative lipopolysaccharide heptosyltransferase III [Burkholderiales bacterium]